MIHVPGPYRPALYKRDKELYAVAGSTAVKVPMGTTLRDLYSDHDSKQQSLSLKEAKAWEVIGSTGNKYIIERDILGSYSCTCLGFNFRKRCSHIERIKEQQ